MSTHLVPNSGGLVARREDRATARSLSHLDSQRTVGLAKLEVAAQLQAAKVEAVGYVASRALHTVALVSQLESQLSQLCPAAVTRLQGLADIGSLAVAEVVTETARKLG